MPPAEYAPLAAAVALEQALGDPLIDGNPGCFAATVRADSESAFPAEICAAAFDWGVAEHLIPLDCGGRLQSVEEAFALSRVLSRRDLTATIAIGTSLLASLPVWLHGTAEQKSIVAGLLRRRAFLSFALNEREHGADVTAGDVVARPLPAGGWRIDGTKWLINNAGHASAAVITARTGDGPRGLTLFLTSPDRTRAGTWSVLPKIHTHGLRGSALGGLTFTGLPLADTEVIGRTGRGLEILLGTLQITRVLVGSFALGALDTSLRAALEFARTRKLYGSAIVALEPVAHRLVDAYASLLIGETLAHAACRAVRLRPSQLPLMSAAVKYLVPRLAIDGIESLSVVLGARSYLAAGHWHGIFEKMRRDCAVTALFDGSAPVNLNIVANHLPVLARARAVGAIDRVPVGMFRASAPPSAPLDGEELELATDSDEIVAGIAAAYASITAGSAKGIEYGRELRQLLRWFAADIEQLDVQVGRNARASDWHRSGAAYDTAARYAHLHAAGACAWRWLAMLADTADPFVISGAWLALCLRTIGARLGRETSGPDEIEVAAMARLEMAYDARLLFSDFQIPLA